MRLTVEEALARVLAGAVRIGIEEIGLDALLRRTLAQPLVARRTQPPYRSSAMDGYAVLSEDAKEGTFLRVIGEAAAGHIFTQRLSPGETVRIFTGGAVPAGADAILIQENAIRNGDQILVQADVRSGQFIRPEGLDFHQGDVLLDAGNVLSPRGVGLAAATGHVLVDVACKPRIAVLSTGDELVSPGHEPGPGQITASNNTTLHALVQAAGAEPIDLGIAADDIDTIRAAIRKAAGSGANVLVTTGGASVGDHDLVRAALAAEGMELDFWRIAMRPGRPMMFGRLGDMRVIGLPGNPVSAHVCALLFLVPLIRALLGRRDVRPVTQQVRLGADLPANDWRQDYVRGKLEAAENGTVLVKPFGRQDSSMLRLLAESDCLIVRPANDPARLAGDPCQIMPLGLSD
ncbi:molybdopterin molybdotransferase MoeA [Terrihabitans sp. B22-R8]|uniref:molybdopterin molybdotransferase MoeA n=1 Tax=Terrihabitans sp. B22-R8 TaxID=3425128 RepID=UPI00403C9490